MTLKTSDQVQNDIINYLDNIYQIINNKEQFVKLYQDFKKSLSIFEQNMQLLIDNNTIENTFKNETKGIMFIKYCHSRGWFDLNDLREFDFNNEKVKGIGQASLIKLGEVYQKYLQDIENQETEFSKKYDITFDHLQYSLIPSSLDDVIKYLSSYYYLINNKEYLVFYNELKSNLELFETKYQLTQQEVKSIEEIFKNYPKGQYFINYCHQQGWEKLSDLEDFDFGHTKIKGIGSSSLLKLEEIFNQEYAGQSMIKDISEILKDIPKENIHISIKLLKNYNFKDEIINKYGLNHLKVEDLINIDIDSKDFRNIKRGLKILNNSVIDTFKEQYNHIKPQYLEIYKQRARGDTLESIGRKANVTRERIRQICVKVNEELMDSSLLVADACLEDKSKAITGDDIRNIFKDEQLSIVLSEVLKDSHQYKYIDSIDKYIDVDIIPDHFFEELNEKLKETVPGGISYEDLLSVLDDIFSSQHFFTEDDFESYLVSLGYRILGDFVFKGKIPYPKITNHIVNKYYDFDIKLDNDPQNEDMKKLRNIYEDYGLQYEHNNRALTSVILRDPEAFVLCGRGRYCPLNKFHCNSTIITRIHNDLLDNDSSTIYYSDLYEIYKDELLQQTNINNYNFLHGILMYYYPDDFVYTRDYLTKKGETIETMDNQFIHIIIEKGQAVSYEEIISILPSLNKLRIGFIIERNTELIYWDKGYYNSINNLITPNIQQYHQIIETLLETHHHYISASILYEYYKTNEESYLIDNNMKTDRSLFYALGYYFSEDYIFQYPHIVRKKDYQDGVSSYKIIVKQLNRNHIININDVIDLVDKMKWKSSTSYAATQELQEKYDKISKDEYMDNDYFEVNDIALKQIKDIVDKNMEDFDFLSLKGMSNYANFPQIGYPWNSFLLETVIKKYMNEYRIIQSSLKDRRYQRSIVVRKESNIHNFDELVVYVMKIDGQESYSKGELLSLLSRYQLVHNIIPQEIYTSNLIEYKKELFRVK